MKSLILVTLCLAIATVPAWGQAASVKTTPSAHGVAGYLDPQTGTFTTAGRVQHAASGAPTSPPPPTQGTFVVGLTINLVNSYPSGEIFICEAHADTFDDMSGLDFDETTIVSGTRSGNTVTCQMTVPYFWPLLDPTNDVVEVDFTVEAYNGNTGTPPGRISVHGIVSDYPMPPQFKVTTFNQGDVL